MILMLTTKTKGDSKMSKDNSYNGWTNYETWNIALWIGNEEFLYRRAVACNDYSTFQNWMDMGKRHYKGIQKPGHYCSCCHDNPERLAYLDKNWPCTPDGVSYYDPKLNISELDEMIKELE